MSTEKNIEKGKKASDMVNCCVKNCGKEIPIDKAIVINGQYFCGICGVAYYRTNLNF